MAFGKLGAHGGFGSSGALQGALASSYAPYPAPSGYRWDFVTSAVDGGQRVTSSNDNNQPVVALVGA